MPQTRPLFDFLLQVSRQVDSEVDRTQKPQRHLCLVSVPPFEGEFLPFHRRPISALVARLEQLCWCLMVMFYRYLQQVLVGAELVELHTPPNSALVVQFEECLWEIPSLP
uniref:Uncharacterized protein n=1 Tax=Knipowitschia caucasica TaxID=637954 RepID=A0AAV2JF56_KNICA